MFCTACVLCSWASLTQWDLYNVALCQISMKDIHGRLKEGMSGPVCTVYCSIDGLTIVLLYYAGQFRVRLQFRREIQSMARWGPDIRGCHRMEKSVVSRLSP